MNGTVAGPTRRLPCFLPFPLVPPLPTTHTHTMGQQDGTRAQNGAAR